MEFDKANGNNLWKEAIEQNSGQLIDFEKFDIITKNAKNPNDHIFVLLHLCLNVKFELRPKVILIAGGSWIQPNTEEINSSLISIYSIWTYLFLIQLNALT